MDFFPYVTLYNLKVPKMQSDGKLEKRIAYEKMVVRISERADSVDDLQIFLDSSLKSLGSTLHVSGISIFAVQSALPTFFCICEWVAQCSATLEALSELTVSIPWVSKEFRQGNVLNYYDTRDVPENQFRESLLTANVKGTFVGAVRTGRSSIDLYCRLNVIAINLPTLREKYRNISFNHSCKVFQKTYNKNICKPFIAVLKQIIGG